MENWATKEELRNIMESRNSASFREYGGVDKVFALVHSSRDGLEVHSPDFEEREKLFVIINFY